MQPVTITQVPVQRFSYVPKFQPPAFQKQSHLFPGRQLQTTQAIEFDGKRLRKAVTRKTVDYNSAIVKHLEARVWQRDYRDRRALQPDAAYYTELLPPLSMLDNPINAVTTKFVRTSTNKMRCPIFCVAWTPEGRRLVTGASSGEFTLWNGLTFNFETILQAHDSPVRCMVWSHNDTWMVTGDHAGYVKYWQSNMNNVKMFQAHKEALRGISFCPLDTKFATCSDDGTVRIWDFLKCFEEKILRGHGADVKCVDWHPTKALLVSGSKDSQQPIKLWDPKSGQSLATIHAHKNTVMDTKWNKNGNWLLTASRDHLIKLFDIRNMKEEMQTFRGHKKEATTLSWHPVHEGLFSSGGSDGSIMFWVVGADKEVGCMEQAHDSCVWSLAWHPLGHILCSGSNDHMSKFWTRNRPGDRMRDKYNLNTLPKGQEDGAEYDDSGTLSAIPGMGLEHGVPDHLKPQEQQRDLDALVIPGLDLTSDDATAEKTAVTKKMPFSKPIPKQFQQQWMESKQPLLLGPPMEANTPIKEEPLENSEAQLPVVSQGQMHMDQNAFAFQENRLPNSRLPPPPPNSMQFPLMEPPPMMPQSILGDRPRDSHQMGPPPPPPHMGRENFNMNMPKQNPHYPENYPPMDGNPGEYEDEWRTYKEEEPEDANTGNGYGPDSRSDHFQKRAFRENKFANEHMPPGPPHFEDKDMRFMNEEMDPRLEDMEYNNSHHHTWQDMPSKDRRYPLDNRPSDYRGPLAPDGRPSDFRGPPEGHHSDFRGPPPDGRPPDFRGPAEYFRPQMRPRGGGPMYFSGRGQRGSFRSRSPYRVVNQRGRGGRGGFND